MKKIIKILGIIILIVVVLLVGGCVLIISKLNDKNNNYYKYSKTECELEKKYTALGDMEVSYKEYNVDNTSVGKIEVWYPKRLESENKTYPMVLIVNGTGIKASTYTSYFKHLASWGFIVVGNEDENTNTGDSTEYSLNYLLKLNEDKENIFYNKIDVNNIALGGHSQGGVGAINAVSKQEHGSTYKTIFTISSTSSYHANILGWDYDISTINIPILMMAGTGSWDAGICDSKEQIPTEENGLAQGICPLWSLEENYSLILDSVDKVIARKKDTDHGDSYKEVDGYVTAWLMYYLQNDEEAGKVFLGEDAEIKSNSLYQDVKINLK